MKFKTNVYFLLDSSLEEKDSFENFWFLWNKSDDEVFGNL